MVTERGKVREIKGNLIIIAPDRSAACFGCMNMECKTAGFLAADNTLGLPVETGQTVEVETDTHSLIPQALTAFLPPILGFATGFILTRLLFPHAGEPAAAFIGLALLFVAALIVYKLRKNLPAGIGYTVARIIR